MLRESARLREALRERGITPELYVAGRKGIGWHRFRQLEVAESWSGFSATPRYADAEAITRVLLERFTAEDNRVDEIHLVTTDFISMLTQRPAVRRLLPLEIEDTDEPSPSGPLPSTMGAVARGGARRAAAAVRRGPDLTTRCSSQPPPSWPRGGGP